MAIALLVVLVVLTALPIVLSKVKIMSKSNDVLDIVFKITDELEYEVAENSVVTILEKQDHKIQSF